MKKINLIYALFLFGALASCKKENQQPTTPKPAVINAVSDSVAYTIDGKTYSASGMGLAGESAGGEDANRKLVIETLGYSLVGVNPDSIMYYQENTLYSTNTNGANINFYFLKKFTKEQTIAYIPGFNEAMGMFAVGKYNFAEDFQWENSQNGVAIDLIANNGQVYNSYDGYKGLGTVAIPSGFQKNSSFQVISLVHATSEYGGYNLVAKFNAVVLDGNGVQKQVTGYLRMNFNPFYSDKQ
jgi:hypothetical protein